MTGVLDARTWRTIFDELSLDAVRPYYPHMGLKVQNDQDFSEGIRSLITRHQSVTSSDRALGNYVNSVFAWASERYGKAFAEHLVDWGEWIYPNDSPRQVQINRWQLIVVRGGLDGARDTVPPPPLVRRLRNYFGLVRGVKSSELKPLSAWDQEMCSSDLEEGLDPFVWVELAVRNFNFLTAWAMAAQKDGFPEEIDRVYQWGLGEAEKLKIPRDGVERPEKVLTLPPSLSPVGVGSDAGGPRR